MSVCVCLLVLFFSFILEILLTSSLQFVGCRGLQIHIKHSQDYESVNVRSPWIPRNPLLVSLHKVIHMYLCQSIFQQKVAGDSM